MFCYKSAIINRHNSSCPIQQIFHLYKHCTLCTPITSILSRRQHYSNAMTSNPTCLDCRRPFETPKGLSIHRNQYPKRQTPTKQKQRSYPRRPVSERGGSASNWHPRDGNAWVDHKLYSGSSTPSAQTNIFEKSLDGSRPQISKAETQIAFRNREALNRKTQT